MQLIEARKRRLEVRFVEDLAADYEVTFEHHEVDCPPFSIEALPRSQTRRVDDDRAVSVQPLNRLYAGADLLIQFPSCSQVVHQLAWLKCPAAPVINVHEI